MSSKTGIMVCGHGSRARNAVAEFSVVATRLKERFPEWPVEYGYLEFATPVIRDGLDALREAGVDEVLAVPGMLFAAGHAKNDIPSVLNLYQAENPGFTIRYGRELAIDTKMVRAAGDRIREALATVDDSVPMHETLLVVVGRGASDPDANSNVSKITRLLWEGMGFGWAETAYSGVTFPLVEPALDHVARLGYKRVVVFPYFLFTGVLINRIYGYTDLVAERYPDIEFVKAPYLNDHPLVIDTFVDRIHEILDGENKMNCQLCKYRTQVLGFETEVGLPQESHHHHVEGKSTLAADCPCNGNCDGRCGRPDWAAAKAAPEPAPGHHHGHGHDHDHSHAHDHDHQHGHDHAHDHHHHPYPHADHPLGPKSMDGK